MSNYADKVLEYFSTNEWEWSTDNVEKLNMELNEVEKQIFNFDMSSLSWPDFIEDYIKVEVL